MYMGEKIRVGSSLGKTKGVWQEYLLCLKVSPQRPIINCKGKNNYTVEKSYNGDILIEINITNEVQMDIMCLQMWLPEKNTTLLL